MRSFLILLLFLYLGCSTPRVVSIYNDNLDFGKYQTYRIYNPLLKKGGDKNEYAGLDELEHAISNQLENRGYQASKAPDVFISYRIIIDPKINYNINYYDSFYYGPYSNPYPTVRRTRFNEGILMIEMTERVTKKMVWQGSLDLKINRKKKNVDLVAESVRLIFNEYHYVAGKSAPIAQEQQ